LGFLTLFAAPLWFWGKMEGSDTFLYFYGEIFYSCEWNPVGFFYSSRDLRQGDPLSPFLFVVVMKALSRMLIATLDQGNLTGFSVGSRESETLVVNHLLFPDDTLIFCGAQEEQIRHLRCIFLCFEATSGLRINLGKSEVVPIGAVEDVDRLAHLLGCRVASLPLTYLGLPLGASYKSVSI
jgi:hypothetical protein